MDNVVPLAIKTLMLNGQNESPINWLSGYTHKDLQAILQPLTLKGGEYLVLLSLSAIAHRMSKNTPGNRLSIFKSS